MENIRSLFFTSLPRRAAVCPVDGKVHDLSARPDLVECETLSRVAEIVREQGGEKVFSRDWRQLMVQCIVDNEAGAWEAMATDLRTGVVDVADVGRAVDAEVCPRTSRPLAATAIECLASPVGETHLLGMCCVLPGCLKHLGEVGRAAAAEAAARNLKPIADAFISHGTFLTASSRDCMLTCLGKMLALVKCSEDDLASLVVDSLTHGRDEVLRLALHVPLEGALRERPHIFQSLMHRTRRMPPGLRYPTLALTLRCMHCIHPNSARDVAPQVARLAQDTIRGLLRQGSPPTDARLLLVCSLLVQTDASGNMHTMAKALECTCAALLATRV